MKPPVIAVALLFASCLLQLSAAPKHSEELKVVRAGDTITFNIRMDTIPDFPGGRVSVLVCPIEEAVPDAPTSGGAQFSRVSSAMINANQEKYDLSVLIPGDAPAATWGAFFSFALPNGNSRELRHAPTEFKVQRRTYSRVPRTVEVSVQVQNN